LIGATLTLVETFGSSNGPKLPVWVYLSALSVR